MLPSITRLPRPVRARRIRICNSPITTRPAPTGRAPRNLPAPPLLRQRGVGVRPSRRLPGRVALSPTPVALNAANYDPRNGRRGAQRGRESGRVSPRNKRVGRLKGLPSRRPLPQGFPGPPPPPLPRPARPQARPFCQYQLTPFVSPALSLESIYIYTY